jgi:hypothetical protein
LFFLPLIFKVPHKPKKFGQRERERESKNERKEMEQRTFETAVSSSASIVKPTVPKNVLAEFEHFAATGSRFSKQQTNPFELDENVNNVEYSRQAAPLPPPPQPQPQIQQQQRPPPQPQQPVDYKDFANFSINNGNKLSQQQPQFSQSTNGKCILFE